MAQIGLLYSSTTGVVLRSINPDNDAHLDWLEQHKPSGTELIRINKSDVGADDHNMPNLDFLIPYVKNNHATDLKFGVTSAIVDKTGKVVDVVICCPDLYQTKLQADAVKESRDSHIVLKGKVAEKDSVYDSKKDKFFTPVDVVALPADQKPVFDVNDVIQVDPIEENP